MDQPCYKCGQTVEEGRVFCPHCGAPQIRVVLAEASVATGGTARADIGLSASETVPVIAIPMRWSQAAQPCAVAALIAAIGIVLRLIVPPIAAIGAGFLAVSLYRRRNPETTIKARSGARIGAISGVFCSCLSAVLGTLRVAILHEAGEIRTSLLGFLQQAAATHSDPQYQAGIEFWRSETGLALLIVLFVIVGSIGIILLAMLGGAVSAASLRRRDRT